MSNASDRRAAPRFDILAQASVVSGQENYLMSVRNLSASGAFLEGRSKDYPEMRPGAEVEVILSAASPTLGDEDIVNVRCRGKVARVELGTPARPGGFGITLEPVDVQDLERLQNLLGRLADLPGAVRSASLG
jgi:hypothetical protein